MKTAVKIVSLAALALALASWIVSPAGSSRPVPEDILTVATWNMEWFPSGWPEPRPEKDERARIEAAAEGLRAQGVPDILVAQEVRDAGVCEAFAGALGARHRLSLVSCSDFFYTPTNRSLQQVAIFSRHPAVAAGSEDWVAGDFVFPPRGFTWAILDVRGELVAVFGVHLKSNYVPDGEDERRQAALNRLKRELAARQLVERAAEIARTNGWNVGKIILAGDFNTAAEDERYADEKTMRTIYEAGFRDAFDGIPEKDRPTLPASDRYPAATFDHIVAKGMGEPFARRVGAFVPVSDHAPLYAAWRIGAKEKDRF